MKGDRKARMRIAVLSACNIILILVAIVCSALYAGNVRASQIQSSEDDFTATIESMKSVSQNYLDSERGYVNDWAEYISKNKMTREQALAYLRDANTSKDRFAHIIDMDTFKAWSAYYPAGKESINTYLKYFGDMSDSGRYMNKSMFAIFNGKGGDATLVGNYPIKETLSSAVSVGARMTLVVGSHTKDYLLLRAIPTESLKKSWVFPAEYQSAEVGMITRDGDYVIQSTSMKSRSFPEYIRAYNFADDYKKGEVVKVQLSTTQSGTMRYKNFKGEECLWYYSSFGDDSNLDIIGAIKVSDLTPASDSWLIIVIICGTLAALLLVDGLYLAQVNKRLRIAAEQASEASKAKTRFFSAMSHDIRTPMNAVLGMISLARKNIDDTPYVTQCLDKASNAGNHLLTLINDVLDISKIESGQLSLLPVEVSLESVFTEISDVMTPLAESRNIDLSLEQGAIKHQRVLADPMRLAQVYTNLVSNAIKYTPAGGSVRVRLAEEPASVAETARVVFTVSDTGIGMSKEFQENMYQSFSRAVDTQVNRTQGSGLGLSIVKQVVDAMGGVITCESTPGEGTTFTVVIDLPVAAIEPVFAPKETDADNVNGMNLLVAEDNELNWEIINAQLDSLGITCERAENGRICLEKISQAPRERYDAILMDVQMPEMTGIEAARRIRTLPAEQNGDIPIIAMTADAFAEDIQTCLDSGMNGHVAKPINMARLQRYLQKIKSKTL